MWKAVLHILENTDQNKLFQNFLMLIAEFLVHMGNVYCAIPKEILQNAQYYIIY